MQNDNKIAVILHYLCLNVGGLKGCMVRLPPTVKQRKGVWLDYHPQ